MFRKSETPVVAGGKISNILGPDTSYKGTLKSDGNVRVDGVYEGHIETAGNVIIGPSGRVLADIVASSVQVWGAVRGNITAQGRLEILSAGRVWGNIRVLSLLIDEGGMFRGQCLMAGEGVEPVALPAEQAQGEAPAAQAEMKPTASVAPNDQMVTVPTEASAPAVTEASATPITTPDGDAAVRPAEPATPSAEAEATSTEAAHAPAPRSRRRAASSEEKGAS